jgi:S-DNA-T family DNA segregation ATPase FtsK/SpoIIIE
VDRCEECDYVFDVDAARLPARLTAVAAALGERLTTAASVALVRRPAPQSWCALELVCHVRDVFLVQRERIVRVLVEDRPSFPPMHRDERAILERYAEQLPATVAAEVSVAARLLAGVLTGRSAAELERPCVYNYPEPAERSLVWIGRNALHEGEHHLLDVSRALASG